MARPHAYKILIDEKQIDLVIDREGISIEGNSTNPVVEQLSASTYVVVINNKPYKIFLESLDANICTLTVNGIQQKVVVQDERDQLLELYGIADSQKSVEREVRAPMPGLVLDILVQNNQEVNEGSGLIVLEAMKMENEIKASAESIIKKIHVSPGDPVAKGDLLIELDPVEV
ncbi:MAG: acetyl-CoA carboxylase biotin carboxyl carrier protein subunit [Rhodothermales bacterium]